MSAQNESRRVDIVPRPLTHRMPPLPWGFFVFVGVNDWLFRSVSSTTNSETQEQLWQSTLVSLFQLTQCHILCSLQCFSFVHIRSLYSTKYRKLPSKHLSFIASPLRFSPEQINCSLFLINLVHKYFLILLYDLVNDKWKIKIKTPWENWKMVHCCFGVYFLICEALLRDLHTWQYISGRG